MTCRESTESLSAYLDGELSADVRLQVEAHLAACRECSTYLDSYKDAVKLAKAACKDRSDAVPAEVPEALVRAILAARRKQ